MQKNLFVFFLMLRFGFVYPQAPDTTLPLKDTTTYGLIKGLVEEQAKDRKVKSVERKMFNRQAELIASLGNIYQEIGEYVKAGVDTSFYNYEFEDISNRLKVAGDGIFENKGTIQTARNLSISSILYNELLIRVEKIMDGVEKELAQFNAYRNIIDSLSLEPEMYSVPSDSVQLMHFFQRVILSAGEHAKLDSTLDADNRKFLEYSTTASLLRMVIKSQLSEIESFRRDLSQKSFIKELPPIWGKKGYSRPFKEIFKFSFLKNDYVLKFYLRNHSGYLLINLLIALILCYLFKNLHSADQKGKHTLKNESNSFFLSHPLKTGFFVSLMIGQFIFSNAPFILYSIYWISAAILLSLIFKEYITRFWFNFWVIFVFLFAGANFWNLILQASRVERYFLVGFSTVGILIALFYFSSKKKNELKEKGLKFFLGIFILFQTLATFEIIRGGYNFGKALFTAGYITLVVGIMLLWAVRIFFTIFAISAERFGFQTRSQYLRLKMQVNKIPSFFYFLVFIGWFVLIGKNFYIYNLISAPVAQFFKKPYVVGDFTFNLQNILLFFFIIILSVVISKFVSFLVANPTSQNGSGTSGSGIGSWLLLLRIAILSIGLLLAFAATGIPIDRLTIIFGGLSVGIGFGLQAIFESLVSGIIIAFEKPINLGDQVQIGSQVGVMKSIGIRSSVVVAPDGSNIVIPNSDLIKSHLINWTTSAGTKRVDFLIGVGYESDLEKAIQIIAATLDNDNRVLKHPKPTIVVNEYAASSIDIKAIYWIELKTNGAILKSDIFLQIRKSFEHNNIAIPFPQMVVHQAPIEGGDGHNTE